MLIQYILWQSMTLKRLVTDISPRPTCYLRQTARPVREYTKPAVAVRTVFTWSFEYFSAGVLLCYVNGVNHDVTSSQNA